jgi:hypothetical protein
VESCCECGDEHSGSCATDLVSIFFILNFIMKLIVIILCG